jgi:hypothetical protein
LQLKAMASSSSLNPSSYSCFLFVTAAAVFFTASDAQVPGELLPSVWISIS